MMRHKSTKGERTSTMAPRERVPVIRTLCEIPALVPPSSRFNVELRAVSGRHFAVIGSSLLGRCGSALACLGLDISFS
ncbi:MAG: hypothetical protein NTY37_03910 [Methanothrix sp.]|nr:hypothetical protein [Methanothrix sp.]